MELERSKVVGDHYAGQDQPPPLSEDHHLLTAARDMGRAFRMAEPATGGVFIQHASRMYLESTPGAGDYFGSSLSLWNLKRLSLSSSRPRGPMDQ